MRIRPAPGLQVRHPVTKKLIPDEGLPVSEEDPVIRRLLTRRDVVEIPDAVAAAPSPPKPSAPKETP